MIDKRIYSEKVAELEKYEDTRKKSNKIFYAWVILFLISCFVCPFLKSEYSKDIPVFFIFILFILCVFDTRKSSKYLEKTKKIENKRNEFIAKILEFVGYRRISEYDFPIPTSLVRAIPNNSEFLSDEYFEKAMKDAYEYGKIKFISDNFDGVVFHIDMNLPVEEDVLVGDFSKNSFLYLIKVVDDWKFFTQNRHEDLSWITPKFRKQIEQIVPIFCGSDIKISNKYVFLQIRKDGINGFLPGIFPFCDQEGLYVKNGDIVFDDEFYLYESACVLEKFNKYIEENNF